MYNWTHIIRDIVILPLIFIIAYMGFTRYDYKHEQALKARKTYVQYLRTTSELESCEYHLEQLRLDKGE